MAGFLVELRRRNVLRVAGAWLVFSWLTLQIVDVVGPILQLPGWVPRLLLMLLAIGFVIALVLAWVYEFTPDGLKRTDAVPTQDSIAAVTGRRLDRIVMLGLAVAVIALGVSRFWPSPSQDVPAPSVPRADLPASTPNVAPIDASPVAASPPRKSVAVLAFDDLSPQRDQAWFVDGLAEEILNSLARLPELQVTARTSAFTLKGSTLTVPEIAAKLGVEHVVEGSVRRAGERLRVTAQLIRAADGFHLWSETYDRDAAAVFAVQEEIATSVARMLDVYLDDDRREMMFASGTRNPAAFEAYLRGFEIFNQAHAGDFSLLWQANERFERAVALDPGYADAHNAHNDAYAHALMGDVSTPDSWPAAQRTPDALRERMLADIDQAIAASRDAAAKTALQIDREFVAGQWSRLPGLVQRHVDERAPGRTIRGAWLGFVLAMLDQDELAERVARADLAKSPLEPNVWSELVETARKRKDLVQAMAWSDAARSAGVEHHWVVEARLRTLLALGRAADAVQEARDLVTGDEVRDKSHLALALAVAGNDGEARAVVAQIQDGRRTGVGEEMLCWIWHELGDHAAADAHARQIDAGPLGHVQLARLLSYADGLPFDPAATPNFVARLRAAGRTPKPYTPFPRPVPQTQVSER